jgi:hypothetical protein
MNTLGFTASPVALWHCFCRSPKQRAGSRRPVAIKVRTARMSRDRGSENIFADLALPNSKQEGTQAQMSALMRCRLVSVSVERSMEFLTILGPDSRSDRQAIAGSGHGPHVGGCPTWLTFDSIPQGLRQRDRANSRFW